MRRSSEGFIPTDAVVKPNAWAVAAHSFEASAPPDIMGTRSSSLASITADGCSEYWHADTVDSMAAYPSPIDASAAYILWSCLTRGPTCLRNVASSAMHAKHIKPALKRQMQTSLCVRCKSHVLGKQQGFAVLTAGIAAMNASLQPSRASVNIQKVTMLQACFK
jgi:hypothetical protein